MKKLYALLAGTILAVMLSVNLVAADVAVGPVPVGAGPGDDCPKVCVREREVSPDGINNCEYRAGQYAFAGETIYYKFAVRDPNGADDIGYVKITIDGKEEVICNEIEFPPRCEHEDCYCDGWEDPLDPLTDKIFECELTVEPSWYDELTLHITVWNSVGETTNATHFEQWWFNPAIALDVSTTDGNSIYFEDGGPGDTVHSINHVKIRNVGLGGVNLWIFLAGTDLYGIDGAAKCPETNVLEIENMYFRGWSGTLDPHGPHFDIWVPMGEYDENDGCDAACYGPPWKTCYGGKPVPGWSPMDNILTNGGLMEVEFKLEYPVPCIGTFSNGEILVFGKAI